MLCEFIISCWSNLRGTVVNKRDTHQRRVHTSQRKSGFHLITEAQCKEVILATEVNGTAYARELPNVCNYVTNVGFNKIYERFMGAVNQKNWFTDGTKRVDDL